MSYVKSKPIQMQDDFMQQERNMKWKTEFI